MVTKRRQIRLLALIVCIFVAALAIAVSLDDRDPLAAIERSTEPACGQYRIGQSLLLSFRDGGSNDAECALAIRSAMAQAGWPTNTTDAVIRDDAGSETLGGLMVLAQSTDMEMTDGSQLPMTFVQILDCRRSLVRMESEAWSGGLSRDLFLHSPCDDAALPIISQ